MAGKIIDFTQKRAERMALSNEVKPIDQGLNVDGQEVASVRQIQDYFNFELVGAQNYQKKLITNLPEGRYTAFLSLDKDTELLGSPFGLNLLVKGSNKLNWSLDRFIKGVYFKEFCKIAEGEGIIALSNMTFYTVSVENGLMEIFSLPEERQKFDHSLEQGISSLAYLGNQRVAIGFSDGRVQIRDLRGRLVKEESCYLEKADLMKKNNSGLIVGGKMGLVFFDRNLNRIKTSTFPGLVDFDVKDDQTVFANKTEVFIPEDEGWKSIWKSDGPQIGNVLFMDDQSILVTLEDGKVVIVNVSGKILSMISPSRANIDSAPTVEVEQNNCVKILYEDALYLLTHHSSRRF